MGMEEATKKGQVQEFSFLKLQRRPMAEWVNVFEKAVLDMRAEGRNVELKSSGWHLFEKSDLSLERQERVLRAAEGEYEFAAIRGALIKLFPERTISQEKRSVPDRKPGHLTHRKRMIVSEIDSVNLVTGGRGVTQLMRLRHMMQKRTRTPRRKIRGKSQT